MKNFLQRFIYLHEIIKIDDEANEKKFLKVAIEKLPDNEYITWTYWGRIGSAGQAPQEIYRGPSSSEAYQAAQKKLKDKYSGGYVDPWNFTGTLHPELNPLSRPGQIFTLPELPITSTYKRFFEQHQKPSEIAKKQHVAFSNVIDDLLLWLTPNIYAKHREYIDTLKPPSDICPEIIRLLELHHDQVDTVNKHLGYRYPYFSIELIKHMEQWKNPDNNQEPTDLHATCNSSDPCIHE